MNHTETLCARSKYMEIRSGSGFPQPLLFQKRSQRFSEFRALFEWHSGGRGFDSLQLHFRIQQLTFLDSSSSDFWGNIGVTAALCECFMFDSEP